MRSRGELLPRRLSPGLTMSFSTTRVALLEGKKSALSSACTCAHVSVLLQTLVSTDQLHVCVCVCVAGTCLSMCEECVSL